MSIISEIARIKNNIDRAYRACQEKGAVMPLMQNSENLADTIHRISTHQVTNCFTVEVSVDRDHTDKVTVVENNAFLKEHRNDSNLFIAYSCDLEEISGDALRACGIASNAPMFYSNGVIRYGATIVSGKNNSYRAAPSPEKPNHPDCVVCYIDQDGNLSVTGSSTAPVLKGTYHFFIAT